MHPTDPAQPRAMALRASEILGAILACFCVFGLTFGASAEDVAFGEMGETLYALNDTTPAPEELDDVDRAEETGEWDDDAWFEDEFELEAEFDELNHDPLEKFNRGVFAFNEAIERFGIKPITDVYQAVTPSFLRTGIHNAFVNLDGPVRIANALMQGRPKASGVALARFVTNSTLGLGGLFEAGERVHLPRQQADFGMTLARWGAPQGPFVMVPLLGPNTLRGGVGMGGDFVMQPLSWLIGPLPGLFVGAGKDLTKREQHSIELESLRSASVDFYAALRSAFLQDRADLVSQSKQDVDSLELASAGSEMPGAAALEARCLDHPRTRREQAKPALRRMAAARCQAAAVGTPLP